MSKLQEKLTRLAGMTGAVNPDVLRESFKKNFPKAPTTSKKESK